MELPKGTLLFSDTPQGPTGGVESPTIIPSHQTDKSVNQSAGDGSQSESDVTTKGGQDNAGAGRDSTHSRSHTATPATKKDTISPGASWTMKSTKYEFHVFTFLNESQPKSWPVGMSGDSLKPDLNNPGRRSEDKLTFDEESLKGDLAEIDYFLEHEAGFRDHLMYKKCPQRRRTELYQLALNAQMALNEDMPDTRRIYEETVEILNRADIVFQFFLPSRYEGLTTGKFWGALYVSLVVSICLYPIFNMSTVCFLSSHGGSESHSIKHTSNKILLLTRPNSLDFLRIPEASLHISELSLLSWKPWHLCPNGSTNWAD